MTTLLAPRTRLVRISPDVAYAGEGSVVTFKIPRNLLYKGLTLHGRYTDAVSVAATSVKTYGQPIERIEVDADEGETLHSVRPADLVREKQTEATRPLGSMLVPPSAVGIASHLGSFEIPLDFKLDDVADGGRMILPANKFKQVSVKLYFTNTHANIYTGGTGVVTFQALYLVYEALMDLPPQYRDQTWLERNTSILLRSYEEEIVTAAADAEFTMELPTTNDIERIYIVTEDANRDPVSTIANFFTLLQDDTLRRLDRVPASSLRSIGSDRQNATLPTGWHCIDFTQPENTIDAALPARNFDKLKLITDKAAVAGFIRVYLVKKAA